MSTLRKTQTSSYLSIIYFHCSTSRKTSKLMKKNVRLTNFIARNSEKQAPTCIFFFLRLQTSTQQSDKGQRGVIQSVRHSRPEVWTMCETEAWLSIDCAQFWILSFRNLWKLSLWLSVAMKTVFQPHTLTPDLTSRSFGYVTRRERSPGKKEEERRKGRLWEIIQILYFCALSHNFMA